MIAEVGVEALRDDGCQKLVDGGEAADGSVFVGELCFCTLREESCHAFAEP